VVLLIGIQKPLKQRNIELIGVTIVSITTCNMIQLNNFLNWRIIWSGMTLSFHSIENQRKEEWQLDKKGSNWLTYTQFLVEQLIWNDIISFHSIENQRSQWYQLYAIGFNCWTFQILVEQLIWMTTLSLSIKNQREQESENFTWIRIQLMICNEITCCNSF
jgi:hypothetical protein